MNQTANEPIDRQQLHRDLVGAAQVRSILSMLCCIPFALGIAVIKFIDQVPAGARLPLFLIGMASPPLILIAPLFVSWRITKGYCRAAVSCPRCGSSLWDCGTGNFKPRRMRVRSDARECPTCHAAIV